VPTPSLNEFSLEPIKVAISSSCKSIRRRSSHDQNRPLIGRPWFPPPLAAGQSMHSVRLRRSERIAEATRHKCTISDLPNEVLALVFSYIPLDEPILVTSLRRRSRGRHFKQPRYQETKHPQIIVLSWVSKQFRRVAHEHSFWHDEDFSFDDLIRKSYVRTVPWGWEDQSYQTIQAVVPIWLDDPHFTGCLARKTSWWFPLLDAVEVVRKAAPDFLHQARSLFLGVPVEGIHLHKLLSNLPICPNITLLELRACTDDHECTPGDLTLLPNLFPGLTALRISPSSCYTGNLHDFGGLTELVLYDYNPGNDSVIPYNSRNTLIRLGFTDVFLDLFSNPPANKELGVGKLFEQFTNIQHLEIYPLHRDLESALLSIHCNPISLNVSFPTHRGPTVDLFLLPCFQHLREVTLGPAPFQDGWNTGLWQLDPVRSSRYWSISHRCGFFGTSFSTEHSSILRGCGFSNDCKDCRR
jgi:F-box-like